MKLPSELIERIKADDWVITPDENGWIMFSKYSPAGQDFNIDIEPCDNVNELCDRVWGRYEDFDCSFEASLWLDSEGHGKNGAPYDMKDLYEDMEACEQFIQDLYDIIKNYIDETEAV